MISKSKQTKILAAVKQMFPDAKRLKSGQFDGPKSEIEQLEIEEKRHHALCGVVIALDTECPPHWQANVLCGRTDRLFEPSVPREIAPSDLKTSGALS